MSTIVLTAKDKEALLALIYVLRDMPLQTPEMVSALRNQSGRLKSKAAGRTVADALVFKGSAARPGGENDFQAQVASVRAVLERWTSAGEIPPSLAPTLIQFTLMGAQAPSLEKAFLAVFCYHFADGFPERYAHLIDRATQLDVFPLRMKAPIEASTPRQFRTMANSGNAMSEPKADSASFGLRRFTTKFGGAATEVDTNHDSEAETLETERASSANSKLTRWAKSRLQVDLLPEARSRPWRPFSGIDR